MSLQLWTLADIGGVIALILLVQFMATVLYSIAVVFPLMGRDYNAAVVCSGYSGLTLGATPTAIANMTAVTEKFGAAPQPSSLCPWWGLSSLTLPMHLSSSNFLTSLARYVVEKRGSALLMVSKSHPNPEARVDSVAKR
ncbi:hypothetical protein NON20_17520 [Synechocystis sp. B12]|nr:hypothetical protein NON20_17520 [Synechocystis sp. B12]